MKTIVIKSDHSMLHGIELSHEQAVRFSQLATIAAILDLNESPRGYQVIYQDGVVRMYDPVNNEIIGAAQPFRGRIGHSS